jgi:hypothetical protein
MKPLEPFYTWAAVLEHIRAGRVTFYHAPMDIEARRVPVSVIGDRVRVGDVTTHLNFDAFDADEGHLDRFRRVS